MVPGPVKDALPARKVSSAVKLLNDWVQPFKPGVGACPAGHQIGSLVAIASAAASVARGCNSPAAFTTATVVFSGTESRMGLSAGLPAGCGSGAELASSAGAASPLGGAASSAGAGVASPSTRGANSTVGTGVASPLDSTVSTVTVPGFSPVGSSPAGSSVACASGGVPPSAYTTVVPTALKTKTAMIVNERRNARAFSNIDPPPEKKHTNKSISPLDYTVLKGQSQRAKGYSQSVGTYGGSIGRNGK